MDRLLGFIFTILGWTVVGHVPDHVKKATFAVCPHNTWKDFFVGLGLRAKIRRNIGFFGKAELFRPPFGFIFKWLGGVPVVRASKENIVESYAKTVDEAEDKLFSLAPEGTRENVHKLRTGFYYISLKANIPIIRVGFDFPKKQVTFGEPFMPSGNFEADMKKYFVPFFKQVTGPHKDWIKNYENDKFDEI
ncbi:MAG: 1-acyl-sn-glycerol-3-phosphate acyltransferase [Spirosomataceae bacterium]|jgi:1-acyl-sn-glycerol-3-phosphate acyltransferase